MIVQKIANKVSSNPKILFLIDGIGAVFSAFLIGIVLVFFRNKIGMPQNMLYILAIIPCFFAIYSLICYFTMPKGWSFLLKIIAGANTLYCCISMLAVAYFYEQLSYLGRLYFLLEFIIVMLLVFIEIKVATK